MVKVSVIIPCRNEAQYIGHCLDSVLKNDYPYNELEILVIDGESEDITEKIVRGYSNKFPFIKLLENPKKIVPFALNIGIRHAKGEVIIRMDAHAQYPVNYISTLVYYLEYLKCDNVGGLWETLPGANSRIAKTIAKATSLPFGIGNAWYRIGTNKIRQVDTVPFGCFHRDLFRKIGMFDEELVRNQDDEFNARIIKHGGKIYLIPSIKIGYYARESIGKMAKMFFQYGFYKPLVNLKIGKPATVRQLVPFFFVMYLVFAAVFTVIVPSSAVKAFGLFFLYLIISELYSIRISLKEKEMTFLFLLPLVFLLIHLSYGLGYIAGIFRFFSKS